MSSCRPRHPAARQLVGLDLCAGSHSLSERGDHHSADLGGVGTAEFARTVGRGRPPQDRPLHAHRDAAAGDVPGLWHRLGLAEHFGPGHRSRRLVRAAGHRLDGRWYFRPDLALRADHPARHRQRHRAGCSVAGVLVDRCPLDDRAGVIRSHPVYAKRMVAGRPRGCLHAVCGWRSSRWWSFAEHARRRVPDRICGTNARSSGRLLPARSASCCSTGAQSTRAS